MKKNGSNLMILHYDFSKASGAQIAGINLANELSIFYDVFSVSLFKIHKTEPVIKFSENVKYEILFPSYIRFSTNLIKISLRLRKFIKNNNINCIITVSQFMNSAVLLATKGLNVKTISWEHSNINDETDGKLIQFRRFLGAKFFDSCVFLTEGDKRSFIEKYNIKKKVSVIPNWVDPLEGPEVNIKIFDELRIMSVGRIEHVKGYDYLIDIALKLKESNVDFSWHIYGSGSLYEEINRKIISCELSNNIKLKGFISDIESMYNQYDLLAMTSRSEVLPLALLEASMYRLPLIAFDVGFGIREIIKNNENGYLIPPYDISLYSSKIKK